MSLRNVIPIVNINGNGNGKHPHASVKPHPKKAANIEYYAMRLIEKYGPFICLGKECRRWNGSIWELTDLAQYEADAIAIQAKGIHSVRAADNIIKMMRMLSRKKENQVEWQYAVRFKGKNIVHISVLNGVVQIDLKTDEINLIAPDSKEYVISQLPVAYDPEAKCETFDYLVESALPKKEDSFMLQSFSGYCLLPDHRFQCALFCYGAPNTGKSLLIYHGIGSVFGENLMSCVSLEKICNGGDELRHLESSLVNIGTEINQRLLDDTDVFNKMTCGERFNSALKYEKSRCLKPMCKHIFVGNHLPGWKRGSDAQARRMKILYFAEDFTDQRKDGQLEREVKLEGSGILNWLIAGLQAVVKLEQMPAGSKESQECAGSFKKHNNPIETFNRWACELYGSAQMPMSEYGRVFRFWCEREGICFNRQVSKVLLQTNPRLKIKATRVHNKGCRVVLGIRFNEEGQYLAAEAPMNSNLFND